MTTGYEMFERAGRPPGWKKCLMLGAGATAGCDVANPDRRPPLVRADDFIRMFDEPLQGGVLTSYLGPMGFAATLREAIEAFDGDIEAVLTVLYFISRELTFDGIPDMLAQEFAEDCHCEEAVNLAEKLHAISDGELRCNASTLLTGALLQEISFCIGTTGRQPAVTRGSQPPSRDHDLLVRLLGQGDVVINFNYDTTADYALLRAGLLSRESFHNPGFGIVQLPQVIPAGAAKVHLYKPHGSFSWAVPHMSQELRLDVMLGRATDDVFRFSAPVILPYRAKTAVLNEMPIFAAELAGCLVELAQSDELIVVGKQFNSGDNDLADKIRAACRRKWRFVTYVDPAASQTQWLEFHNELFNASPHAPQTHFGGIREYAEHLATVGAVAVPPPPRADVAPP